MAAAAAAVEHPQAGICRHCGTPYRPQAGAAVKGFCCAGCAHVHHLINAGGLDRYYALKDQTIAPVRPGALDPRDYRWLGQAATTAEAAARTAGRSAASLDLDLEGISCIACVWLIEEIFKRQPGARQIELNAQLGRMRLHWQAGAFDLPAFARAIQDYGYLVAPVGRRQRPESSGLLLRLGLCGAFALNAMVFTLPRYLGMEPDFVLARLFSLLTLACASLSLLVGGGYFIRRALAALRRGVLHIDLPISLGIVFAYAGSLVGWARDWERFIYFDFVAIFVFLMLVGRWTQERAVDYNRHRLVARSRRPDTVRLAGSTDGDTPAMPLAQLTADTAIRVDPGDVVPVLSRLGSSAASCSLEWINGESAMRRFAGGELVPGGAVNIGIDPIELRTCESWPDSLLARLLREEQQDFRNPLLERVLRVYLGVVLALAAAGWAFWTFGPPGDPLGAFQVLLSVLVVSCPCAFGVAAPLAQEWAILRLRGAGLFVREATLFARLAGIRHIIFDKTGTLTLEAPRLLQPETLGAMPASARAVLRRLVADSLHPVGRALRQALRALPPDAHAEPVPALTVREEIGQGLAAVAADGAQWTLGRPGWRDSGGTAAAGRDVVLARAGQPVAAFAFAEALRDDAVGTLAQLRQRHELWILSGDQPAKVARMAARLGLPAANAHGGLDPAAKAAWVARLDRGDTLYIGDGVNDSLAFDRAAARGTPVVDRGLLEGKADFFFTGNGLGALPRLFAIGRLRQRATRTVFGFTICYNIVVAAVALAGQMHPLLAAIVMPLSSLVSIGLVAWAFRKA